jgi:hypothetical protein
MSRNKAETCAVTFARDEPGTVDIRVRLVTGFLDRIVVGL